MPPSAADDGSRRGRPPPPPPPWRARPWSRRTTPRARPATRSRPDAEREMRSSIADEVPTLPQHSGFGSVWDSQIGVPAERGRLPQLAGTAVPEEPARTSSTASRRCPSTCSPSGASRIAIAAVAGAAAELSVRDRSGALTAPGRGRASRAVLRPGTQRRSRHPTRHALGGPRSMPWSPIEQTPGGDPWSEVPPEVQEMLRAELARRQAPGRPRRAQQRRPSAPSASGRASDAGRGPGRRGGQAQAHAAPPQHRRQRAAEAAEAAGRRGRRPRRPSPSARRAAAARRQRAPPTAEAPAAEAVRPRRPSPSARRAAAAQPPAEAAGGVAGRWKGAGSPAGRGPSHAGAAAALGVVDACGPAGAAAARPAHRRSPRRRQDDAGARPGCRPALPGRRSRGAAVSGLRGVPQGGARQPPRPPCLAPEGAGEQIRLGQVQQLGTDLALTAIEGRFRVAIISSAQRLNPDAQNALLKTLEEPGPATCLVLCADDSAAAPADLALAHGPTAPRAARRRDR